MEEVLIRVARPDDWEGIKAVFKSHQPDNDWGYAKRYYQSYFFSPHLHTHAVVMVAVLEGRIVGVVGYLRDRTEIDDVFWLGWFYVHAAEGGKGYGELLLNRVVEEVKERGARKLYTDTSSWGFYARAHRRYRQYGFRKEARLKDYYSKGEHQVIYGMTLR